MIRPAKRWLVGIASAGLMALSLPMVATTAALAVPQQSGPFWPGNLLSMNNADFENGVGDWNAISGANPLTTDTTAYLHNHALKIVASGTAPITSVLQLSGTSGIEISVNPGGKSDKYRVGAYVQMPATSGHTTEFDLGCYDSTGQWLGWSNGTPVANNSTGAWQWVEDDITLPSACTHVQGSPRVQFTDMHNGGTIHMDEVWFAPYRAALMIGADDPCSSPTSGSCDWQTQNATGTTGIGPLQTEKEFYGPDTTLPSSWSDSSNDCYNIEQVYSSDHSKWPTCIIAFKYDASGTVQSQAEIQSFLKGMPSDQQVVMVFWQEAEDSYPGTSGQFMTDFETEAGNIRAAAAADSLTQNVFVAQDSSTYQYYNGDGVGCGWIVPSSYTDYYLADHYTRDETSGGASMPNQPSPYSNEWTGWLNCVKGNNKPIGLAEYGMCSGGVSLCKGSPCPGGTSNTSDITHSISDDNTYLAGDPGGPEPVVMWSYWQYSNFCNYLTPGGAQAVQWQSNENQNGGAVGG